MTPTELLRVLFGNPFRVVLCLYLLISLGSITYLILRP